MANRNGFARIVRSRANQNGCPQQTVRQHDRQPEYENPHATRNRSRHGGRVGDWRGGGAAVLGTRGERFHARPQRRRPSKRAVRCGWLRRNREHIPSGCHRRRKARRYLC
ncbi:hypothetical protein RHECNPAF_13300159 [Rhizobium etli CNPAF512]|nr:hypothetical protein RHECNPAF_13300159 [Rhizobium etli CNPAF512]